MAGTVLVQTLYLSVEILGTLRPVLCRQRVAVTPESRRLRNCIVIARLVPEQSRLIGVLFDQLMICLRFHFGSLFPPTNGPVARPPGSANPEDPGLIKQMAKRVAVSPRALERVFQKETGMTFGRWRQQLQLFHALRLLAAPSRHGDGKSKWVRWPAPSSRCSSGHLERRMPLFRVNDDPPFSKGS